MKTTIRVPEEYKPLLEDLRELTKDGENPNHMTKRARQGLWKSMQKYGWIYPILVDKKGMLGDGEQRLETCLAHKEFYGPVLRLDVDDIDRRLLRQVTNKLRGRHDIDLDRAEYRRLIEGGRRKELISILQLNEKTIKDALEGKLKADTFTIPPLEDVDTDIELGDLYQVGLHRILCGDSTQAETYDAIMQEEKADMIFTDPPYGVSYEGGTKKREPLAGDESPSVYKPFLVAMKKHIRTSTPMYICYASLQGNKVQDAIESTGWSIRSQIIWNKNHAQFGALGAQYKYKHEPLFYAFRTGKVPKWYGPRNEVTVWDIPKPSQSKLHPTMKPVELCARAIGNSSIVGDTILDPFAGSGSTLIACEQLDRKGYMIELDPRYCQIIIDRFEAYTGETAEKV